MRPIDKGVAPQAYTNYRDARPDLANRIGYYCSFCEMGVNNMLEVEHIHPVANGGNELDWDNFLLSCKYCNTVKSNNNPDRAGYFWPDTDNTDLLFSYTTDNRVLEVTAALNPLHLPAANQLINLVGLNRYPGGVVEPTKADVRWRLRDEVMITAQRSFLNWEVIKDDDVTPFRIIMARQIAETSIIGFYSIWYTIFEGEEIVLEEIDRVWMDRYHNYKMFDLGTATRTIRAGGQI